MTPLEVRDALVTQIYNGWTVTDISWPNVEFDPSLNSSWIRPTLKMGTSLIGENGESGVGMRNGAVIIDIFTPKNSGDRQGLTYAGQIEDLYRREDLSGVILDEPSTNSIGISQEWFQTNVVIPFHCWIGE